MKEETAVWDPYNVVAVIVFSFIAGMSAMATPFLVLFLNDVSWGMALGPLGIIAGVLGIRRCNLHGYYAWVIPLGVVAGLVVGFIGPAEWLWDHFFRLF